ncbi:hypothetical protein Cgig2_017092 [Carnegiea gigantea]|uniref:WIYLD domain-containing protein n=1 Tax=Carnegiea gigantea TaxID=171969 RepID=A0A9Q1QC10_9CARY|nr:hypothetical protein Cgig2_017092 [Carnegiea gigantea]
MAPRGRPRGVGNTRMDAAIDALKPMGFLPDVIRKKVRELLEVDAFFVLLLLSLYQVYGGPEGWAFIEEASYKLLIDSILEDQENEKCALREPNLLEDQEREKPGESAFENVSKSIQDALVPMKGILISEVLTNQVDFDVQISLALYLFELIRITAPNSPFEDELMKKPFRVIVSTFEALFDSDDKSYHKRLRILESMSRVRSYVVLLDIKCDALFLDMFYHLVASIKDDHSPLLLEHTESILLGILEEADDLLLEFLIYVLSWSEVMGSPSSTAQVMSKRVLEMCASRVFIGPRPDRTGPDRLDRGPKIWQTLDRGPDRSGVGPGLDRTGQNPDRTGPDRLQTFAS